MVAHAYGSSIEMIESRTRASPHIEACKMCMVLFKDTTTLSLKAIGKQLGGRSYCTVWHDISAMRDLISTEFFVKKMYIDLRNRIKAL
jgi:chromosomal replication initiation ATPase DnaA